jgi:lipoprotein NlpI
MKIISWIVTLSVILCFYGTTVASSYNDDELRAILILGNDYTAKGEYDRAITQYNKAIKLDPKEAWSYNNRGLAYHKKGEYSKAITDYTKTIELDPRHRVAYYNRGNTYTYKGEFESAIANYNHAIGLDPKFKQAYVNRGTVLYYKGEHDKAIADFNKAIKQYPKYAQAFKSRGEVYRIRGEYEKAVADYSKTVELDPKNEYAHLRLFLSSASVSEESLSSAKAKLRDLVKNNNSEEWIRNITKYYLSMDEITEKMIFAETVKGRNTIEINSRICEACYYLGELRLMKGDRKGAEYYFKKSVETKSYGFIEYHASKMTLEQMKQGKR